MSAISFCFESNQVRVLGDIINPLFVALDICKALGFKNHKDAILRHVDPEDLCKETVETNGGRQEVNCVNESGMYALIFGSKLPSAKRFKKWVTSEVLPTIRKTGQYSAGDNTLKSTATLTPAQQLLVRQAVVSRAKTESKSYQTIYRAIYNRFQIARYDQLQQSDLNECLKFIQEVDLNVPVAQPHTVQPAQTTFSAPTTDEDGMRVMNGPNGRIILLSPDDLDRLRGFVYAYRYLFRKETELFYEFLKSVKSPYAGKFYDAMTDWSLGNIERILDKVGYPVKELDCYKSWASHQ